MHSLPFNRHPLSKSIKTENSTRKNCIHVLNCEEVLLMPHCFQSLHQLFNMNVATRLLVFTIAFALVQGNTSTLCPTGYNYNKSISRCECSPYLSDGVLCIDPGHAYLRIDYCMTLESLSNMSIAGNCHRGHYNHHQMIRGVYGLLPNDSSKLTDAQCKPNNRHGLLCAKCIDGYGVAVTSLSSI